ncbi:group III truncated hemoglobin [Capnocytophaga sp. ARDL2]|uniref:group III truncated hemoglobin n=1 Tax=Capnocytophaga sp. ARDL2 TaxID=3238809 RepID=UPI0035578D0F
MKTDIQTIEDVQLMVDTFYDKVNKDEMLSYVFNDFAQIDWDEHLPKMYRFWHTLIFGEPSYKGNPFAHHIPLPINEVHFTRWLEIFNQNMDEHFEGINADEAKTRAYFIAQTFQKKLEFINKYER